MGAPSWQLEARTNEAENQEALAKVRGEKMRLRDEPLQALWRPTLQPTSVPLSG